MFRLGQINDYGIGQTPLLRIGTYCPIGNLFIKLERFNPTGSTKDRAAFFIISDLIKEGRLKPGVSLVESSSGNLGLALGFLAKEIGIGFTCLVDPTISKDKLLQLNEAGVRVHIVAKGYNPDYREARISLAKRLDKLPGWIWTNQYDNLSNFAAHYETTGPEIWQQTDGQVDFVVCSIGTGGTVCGIGKFLKEVNPNIKVVAVEPVGSTIFGGTPGDYINAGAGMRYPSGIVNRYGRNIDLYCKIEDKRSIQECIRVSKAEGLSGGITTGSVLAVASYLASSNPKKIIVALSPDGGEKYSSLIRNNSLSDLQFPEVNICFPEWHTRTSKQS